MASLAPDGSRRQRMFQRRIFEQEFGANADKKGRRLRRPLYELRALRQIDTRVLINLEAQKNRKYVSDIDDLVR